MMTAQEVLIVVAESCERHNQDLVFKEFIVNEDAKSLDVKVMQNGDIEVSESQIEGRSRQISPHEEQQEEGKPSGLEVSAAAAFYARTKEREQIEGQVEGQPSNTSMYAPNEEEPGAFSSLGSGAGAPGGI